MYVCSQEFIQTPQLNCIFTQRNYVVMQGKMQASVFLLSVAENCAKTRWSLSSKPAKSLRPSDFTPALAIFEDCLGFLSVIEWIKLFVCLLPQECLSREDWEKGRFYILHLLVILSLWENIISLSKMMGLLNSAKWASFNSCLHNHEHCNECLRLSFVHYRHIASVQTAGLWFPRFCGHHRDFARVKHC